MIKIGQNTSFFKIYEMLIDFRNYKKKTKFQFIKKASSKNTFSAFSPLCCIICSNNLKIRLILNNYLTIVLHVVKMT